MSRKHPVVAITGSSGAGTSTVTETFQQIFLREGIKASVVHGDAFHRYDRAGMKRARQEVVDAGKPEFSHFGPEANLFEDLEALFRQYGEDGTGKIRDYVHDNEEAAFYRQPPGTFTTWQDLPPDTDVLYYEGLHGAVQTEHLAPVLPAAGLQVVARTQDGEVMAVKHRDFDTYGLQFHPESILTPNGSVILQNFLGMTKETKKQ